MISHILSIAGTDPTSGAGIQADLKAMLRAYGMSVITTVVAQNTQSVRRFVALEPDFVASQVSSPPLQLIAMRCSV
ncbi:bifunctional hydroxymethylpyrimidine kinase/phosphomethylpyrimidine kinase [Alcaligenes aquatilis]|uniref:bifunctional hydroxymethylpyrimidine kinase/phosphomethylpyrimidine kinase n=1 Tax=Alcaligenes aquatilis TaxID=323284 RepID=UPI003F8F9E2A